MSDGVHVGKRWLLIGSFLLGGNSASATDPQVGAHIPPFHGADLTGEAGSLPDEFQGKGGVLVIGFSQASRAEATAWGKRLAADYRDADRVIYYEMPMLASVPRLLRGWVVKKIAAELPDRAKARFLPLYDHEAEWRAAAAYASPNDAYILVVDSAGAVRFRFEGDATDTAYAEVKKRINETR